MLIWEESTMDTSQQEYGTLVVRVYTADSAIPIEDALVYIYEMKSGATVAILKTDRNGLTRELRLPTPSTAASQRPDGGAPYSLYRIRTSKDGYYSVQDINVPVYPKITSVQPVAMIPLEYGNNGSSDIQNPPDDVFFDENRQPNL